MSFCHKTKRSDLDGTDEMIPQKSVLFCGLKIVFIIPIIHIVMVTPIIYTVMVTPIIYIVMVTPIMLWSHLSCSY